jgi:hypothetical protein
MVLAGYSDINLGPHKFRSKILACCRTSSKKIIQIIEVDYDKSIKVT